MAYESQPPVAEEGDEKINREAAMAEIEAIRREIYMLGANDSEFNRLDGILKKMEDGTCTPQQAVEEAHKISTRKMDYH